MTTEDPRGVPPEPKNLVVVDKPKMGRPTKEYDEVAASRVCAYVASGMKLDDVARMEEFPSAPTLYRWLASNEEFARSYAAALSWRTERRIDELLETSRDGSKDFEPSATGADGEEVLVENKETLGRSRLHSENIKWVIEREMPRKYHLVDQVPMLPAATAAPNAPPAGSDAGAGGEIIDDPMKSNYAAWDLAARNARVVNQK